MSGPRSVRLVPCLVLLALAVAPAVASGAQLTLTWTDNANNETGYWVERRIGGGSYSQIATLAANSTGYTDPNLAAATSYCYRVRAFNGAGASGYSNEACKTTAQVTLELTVNKAGSGSGTVTSSPLGINCGSDCTEAFLSGVVVTLTATPSSGSRFDGWSGGGCAGTGPCTLIGNASPVVTATFTTIGATCATGQYEAEYYSNSGLSGTPTFSRCETAIDNNWGSGGPGNGVGSDDFSVRWTGRFNFAAGSYVFTARADDGIRVWVDGASVINAWQDQGPTTYQATVPLTAGTHEVRVEYYERGGGAVAEVTWEASSGATCATGQYEAEYYSNSGLSGTPTFSRCETAIDNNWGSGGPGNGVGSDDFSVRWTGRFNFAAGSYVFTVRADDGIRVWVDGASVINAWRDQAPTTYQATVPLTAGTHEVRVEYYERGGGAVAEVTWEASSGATCATGQYEAEYYSNRSLSGTPTFSRCETAIDNNWGSGGPGNGVGSDDFSVRWTGRFNFAAGSYVFTVRADDGIRVWVDGASVINAWRDQAPTTYQATVPLTAGTHEVRVEYYERGGGAVAEVSW